MRNAEQDAIEKAQRRERLLDEAFRLFAARSIESVKLTEIAEAAGLGIVTLYRYFKTKPDLVIELGTILWLRYYVDVEAEYEKRGGARMNAAEELEFFIDSIIELYRSHKDVLRFNRLAQFVSIGMRKRSKHVCIRRNLVLCLRQSKQWRQHGLHSLVDAHSASIRKGTQCGGKIIFHMYRHRCHDSAPDS